jgi:hypothetical protein
MIAITPSLVLDTVTLNLVSFKVSENLATLISGVKTLDAHIRWDFKPEYMSSANCFIKYYRVYRNQRFIGVTKTKEYLDVAFEDEETLEYRVDAVSLKNEILATLIVQEGN